MPIQVSAERIVSLTFPNHEEANKAKNKLRRHHIHAYLSPVKTFNRYPGKDAWNAAHRVLNVVDHFPETGDTMDMIRNVLER